MRKLTHQRGLRSVVCGLPLALALAALLLASGCQTTEPSVTGTIRTPDVIYGTPGQPNR